MNYGVLPDTQLHLIVPMTTVGGDGVPTVSGLGDTEFGIKYRFLHETNGWPQIGIFPMAELPTGDAESRVGQRASVVPIAVVAAKKLRAVDDLRRRRRGIEFRARPARSSLRRLARAARFRPAPHARRRIVCARPGHGRRQADLSRSISAVHTTSTSISACCSARATALPATSTRSGISGFTGLGDRKNLPNCKQIVR